MKLHETIQEVLTYQTSLRLPAEFTPALKEILHELNLDIETVLRSTQIAAHTRDRLNLENPYYHTLELEEYGVYLNDCYDKMLSIVISSLSGRIALEILAKSTGTSVSTEVTIELKRHAHRRLYDFFSIWGFGETINYQKLSKLAAEYAANIRFVSFEEYYEHLLTRQESEEV